MPTNDERREVAARLRDMAPGSDWPNYVAEACGMDVSKMSNNFHTFTEQLCQRIADLIDRETCHDVGGGYKFRCSRCGCMINIYRDGGFGEDDSTITVCGDCLYGPRFCPNCGAEVVYK